ncbi:MAG: hypothetical protein Q9226_001907 [Calogaya cf. arnoldii]
MRPTYWAFIRLWPERSAAILSALTEAHRKVLVSESAEMATAPAPAKAAIAAVAAKSVPVKPKQSVKDTIAAKRAAAQATKAEASASTSHQPRLSPPLTSRPAPVATATRNLSSAPVRPARMTRKPTHTSKTQSEESTHKAIDTSKAVVEVSTTLAAEVTRPAIDLQRPEPTESEVRRTWIEEAFTRLSQPPTPTASAQRSRSSSFGSCGKVGLSSERELTPPPLIVALRSRSPSVSEQSSSELDKIDEDEFPNASLFSASKASETANSSERPCNVPSSRKEARAREALKELSVNEPIKRKPQYGENAAQEKWKKVERQQLSLSTGDDQYHDPASLHTLRQTMRSHIDEIKSDRWGLNTFRDIQRMIRSSWPLLGDDVTLFDELLFTLFNHIDSWSGELAIVRDCGSDQNTQVLLTLRILLRYHNAHFSVYFPRALCALLSASRRQSTTTHMRFGLEDTVKSIIQECDIGNLEDSIDSVLDFLESYTELNHRQPEYLGLLALTELMKTSDPERKCRPMEQACRLGKLVVRALRSPHPEIRQRAIQFATNYAYFLADDSEFWRLTDDISLDRQRLLTYYFTKERLTHAFVQDHTHAHGADLLFS